MFLNLLPVDLLNCFLVTFSVHFMHLHPKLSYKSIGLCLWNMGMSNNYRTPITYFLVSGTPWVLDGIYWVCTDIKHCMKKNKRNLICIWYAERCQKKWYISNVYTTHTRHIGLSLSLSGQVFQLKSNQSLQYPGLPMYITLCLSRISFLRSQISTMKVKTIKNNSK